MSKAQAARRGKEVLCVVQLHEGHDADTEFAVRARRLGTCSDALSYAIGAVMGTGETGCAGMISRGKGRGTNANLPWPWYGAAVDYSAVRKRQGANRLLAQLGGVGKGRLGVHARLSSHLKMRSSGIGLI